MNGLIISLFILQSHIWYHAKNARGCDLVHRFTTCKLNSTEVQNPRRKLSLSSLITLPQTVRLFYVSLRSQAPQQQYTVLSFSSMRRHGHSHKLTFTCTTPTVLHCGHNFLRRIDLLHSIACTTILHCGHTFLNLS